MPTRPNETFGRDLGGARLLVIDDEESVRRLVRRMLGDCNCRIIEAADGFDGLMLIEREPAMDLIITDLAMPRVGGLAVVQSVLRRYPEIPVVVMSGNSAAMGIVPEVPVLRKPFAAGELLSIVWDQLSRRRRSASPVSLAVPTSVRVPPRARYRSPPR